jgi:hypothetical protein
MPGGGLAVAPNCSAKKSPPQYRKEMRVEWDVPRKKTGSEFA